MLLFTTAEGWVKDDKLHRVMSAASLLFLCLHAFWVPGGELVISGRGQDFQQCMRLPVPAAGMQGEEEASAGVISGPCSGERIGKIKYKSQLDDHWSLGKGWIKRTRWRRWDPGKRGQRSLSF